MDGDPFERAASGHAGPTPVFPFGEPGVLQAQPHTGRDLRDLSMAPILQDFLAEASLDLEDPAALEVGCRAANDLRHRCEKSGARLAVGTEPSAHLVEIWRGVHPEFEFLESTWTSASPDRGSVAVMASWPFPPPITPMEAKVRTSLPDGDWAYEPKWDGFRAIAWSGHPRLDSRNHKPLLRYFPELEDALRSLPSGSVVDGEVVVVTDDRLDFDALQNRLHPAKSRVDMLAASTPARLVAFDLLAAEGEDLREQPFRERRRRLEELLPNPAPGWHLTPSTTSKELAADWFTDFEAAGCDGIVAKSIDGPYVEGKREMVKVKHRRSVECVIGGYRIHKDGDKIGSILLGLYEGGELHFIGHCSGFSDHDRGAILHRLEAIRSDDSFGEGVRRPGGESRWSSGKDLSWVSVEAGVVVQVSYDQLTGGRFRHATRFERWRPDKDASECTLDQLERPEGPGFTAVVAGS